MRGGAEDVSSVSRLWRGVLVIVDVSHRLLEQLTGNYGSGGGEAAGADGPAG